MNRIKFDKEELKNFLKENKSTVNEIFSNEENLKKLENNDFINLYLNDYTYNNRLITGTLLFSDIDFLPYLDKIPIRCFYNLDMIKSILIPNTVTSIGNYAFFDCTNLSSITIPSSITSIGEAAFQYCTSLTSISIPNGVTSIEDSIFDNCRSLTSINIPNGVTSIGDYAFFNCSSLTSITIPNGVTSIGEAAFYECIGLISVTIGNGVESIGNNAFSLCSSLQFITFKGTKNEWRNIKKGYHWKLRSNIKEIKCIDGTIKL